MIISDLEHLEVVRKENSVKGGYASAYAFANAYATGNYVAITSSTTYTGTLSNYSFIGYYSPGSYR